MDVPFFDMQAEVAAVRGDVDAAISRVLDSGTFVGGPEVVAFERELAAATGSARAIGVSSGTDALHVLAMTLDLQPGDEIITTPLTFFATAGAFARLGATIVFADIDDATLCMSTRAVESQITPRTRAIVPVHLFGHPVELPATSIPIIEDAAQSITGAPLRGRAAALSFFPTKNLGALGDAGAVLTNDPELAERVTLLRTQGARPKYHHIAVGGNFRLDALQAAVLRAKLPHLARWTTARCAIATRYRELLARTPLRLPAIHPQHVYHHFVVRPPDRDALRVHLASRGIGTEIYYPEPLHTQPWFHGTARCPIAERACRELLALPIYPTLTPERQARVADAIVAFYA